MFYSFVGFVRPEINALDWPLYVKLYFDVVVPGPGIPARN